MAVTSEVLEIGTPLIDFRLPDVNGKLVSSDEYRSGLSLIVFTCNHCPYALASWPVLIELQNRFASSGYRTVAINPNNNPDFPDDSFDKMKPFAETHGIGFPYLFDETQAVAKAYRAACTPDPYLFHDGVLVYHGRINDNWQKPAEVKEKSLELNILARLQNTSAPAPVPSLGCSIKWVR